MARRATKPKKDPAARPLRALLRVEPGARVDLTDYDCGATFGREKEAALAATAVHLERLSGFQARLWAEAKRAVLVVLQGIDASGKDGTIRSIMGAFNPQGTPVAAFKVPTPLELAHDYLWRVHAKLPAKGEIGIFNRSHYEDVLIVRVAGLVAEERWRRRYRQIVDWERTLSEEGLTIVKLFLAIDRDEQRKRFQERLDDPAKRWKYSTDDLAKRKQWDDYREAFEDVLEKTSTEAAPWYLIPSNRNWFRNLAVAEILVDVLAELDPRYPQPEPGLDDIVVE